VQGVSRRYYYLGLEIMAHAQRGVEPLPVTPPSITIYPSLIAPRWFYEVGRRFARRLPLLFRAVRLAAVLSLTIWTRLARIRRLLLQGSVRDAC
jgi:hypothetical protein